MEISKQNIYIVLLRPKTKPKPTPKPKPNQNAYTKPKPMLIPIHWPIAVLASVSDPV